MAEEYNDIKETTGGVGWKNDKETVETNPGNEEGNIGEVEKVKEDCVDQVKKQTGYTFRNRDSGVNKRSLKAAGDEIKVCYSVLVF